MRNCAGGVTPWGTWITYEETERGPWMEFRGRAGRATRRRSSTWAASRTRRRWSIPHRCVYETEDTGDCGLYKFVPYRRGEARSGAAGSTCSRSATSRTWTSASALRSARAGTWSGCGSTIRRPRRIRAYDQGAAKGGARFIRLEGAWWGDQTGFFLSTSGGSVGEGQVFEYDPRDETLTLDLRLRRTRPTSTTPTT